MKPELPVKAITAYVYETFLENIDMDFAKREGLLFVGGFAIRPMQTRSCGLQRRYSL